MSLNHPDIPRLGTIDMTSDERRTFYALEWKNPNNGDQGVYAYSSEEERDRCAPLELANGNEVCIYNVIANFGTDVVEVEDFLTDNLRING